MSRWTRWGLGTGLASLAVISGGWAQAPSTPEAEAAQVKLVTVEKQIAAKEAELADLRAKAAALRRKASGPAADRAEEDAARVLIRRAKAKMDGLDPPAAWPEKVRRVGAAWVADIETGRLPGGYPEQIVVEVTATGGHTGKPRR